MKKIICIITLLIISLISLFCFNACGEKVISLVSVKLDENNKSEILVGSFNYSEYNLILQFSDGSTQTVPFDESMVDTNQILSLYKTGDYKINVSYQGFNLIQDISVKINVFSDDIVLVCKSVVYDGQSHSLEIDGPLPEGTTITYPKGNSFINANTYELSAVLASDTYVSKTIYGTLEIKQAVYEINDITFTDISYVYDGLPKSICVSGNIPEDLSCSYYIEDDKTNEATNAGTYLVEARFYAGPNYEKIQSLYANLIIQKGYYDMSNYKLVNKVVTYNGQKHSIKLTNEDNLPSGVNVIYENNDQVTAGSYIVKANFYGDTNNYNEITPKEATLTINKANINLTGINFDNDKFTYDGQKHYVYYTGNLPTGVSFVGYTNNGQVDSGEYTVLANFSYYDTINYNAVEPLSCKMIIEKTTFTGIVFNDASYTYDSLGHSIVVESVPNGVTVNYENNGQTEPGSYLVTATFDCDESFLNNYEQLSPLKATLTINKKTIGTSFTDITVNYDGNSHSFDALGNSSEKEWMNVYYYTLGINNAEIEFKGATEPGSYLVFARFTVKNGYSSLYETYYEELDRQSAILTINKIEYIPKFVNRTTNYTGSEQSVLVDYDDADNYPGLSFDVVYENNTQTEPGIYTATAHFTLTGTSSNYYKKIEDVTFNYCIKNGDNVFSPSIVGNSVIYDGNPHSLQIKNNIEGIDIQLLNNTGTNPGIYIVTVVVNIYDPILSYYYSYPSDYDDYISGGKYTQVNLRIEKQEIVLSYDEGPFVYTGENYNANCLNNPDWVTIDYCYEQEQRIAPGTYSVTATPRIIDSEKAKLYKVSATTFTFTIDKAYASYSISDLTIKYDGLIHEVKVYNLPDDIEYYTSGDKKVDVGVYSVSIYFINNNPNYYDIPKQLVTLRIEYTTVDISSLITYQISEGRKYVQQYSNILGILSNYVDLYSLDITWQAHYFKDAVTMYPQDDLTRHGDSTGDNFVLRYPTSEDEYVFFMYNIKPKSGYEFSDSSLGSSYSGSIQFTVGETESVNIMSISTLNNTSININQYTLFSQFISSYIDTNKVDYLYYIYYSMGDSIYPSTFSYSRAEKNYDEDKDFTFIRPTWEGTKANIILELKAKSGYCLYDGEDGCLTKSLFIEANIIPFDSVDSEFITSLDNNIEFDQFDNIYDILDVKIDSSIVDFTWNLHLKDDNNILASSSDELINNEELGIVNNIFTKSNIQDLVLSININIKKLWKCNCCNTIFENELEPSSCINHDCNSEEFIELDYYFYGSRLKTYSCNLNVIINPKIIIEVDDIISLYEDTHNKETEYLEEYIRYVDVDRYSKYFRDVFTYDTSKDGLSFSWLYYDVNGDICFSSMENDIEFTQVSDGIYSHIELIFGCLDGYIISYNDIYYTEFRVSYYFNVLDAVLVDVTDFTNFIDEYGYKTIQQYSTINEESDDILLSISSQCVDIDINLIIVLYDDEDNLIEMKTASYVDNYMFTKPTNDGWYYKVIYILTLNKNMGYVFDGDNGYYLTGIRNYIVEKRDRFIDPKVLYLNQNEQELYQYDSLYEFISSTNLSKNFEIYNWTIDYYDENDELYEIGNGDYHSLGNGLMDFTFKQSTQNNLYVLCYVSLNVKDGFVYYNEDGNYVTNEILCLVFNVKPRYFVKMQNITNYTNNNAYVEQFSHLSDCIKSLFVDDTYYDDIQKDWVLTHSQDYDFFRYTRTPSYTDIYFYLPITSGAHLTLNITFTGNVNHTLVNEADVAVDSITCQFDIYINNWTKISLSEYSDFWQGNNQIASNGSGSSTGSLYDLINLDDMLSYADITYLKVADSDTNIEFTSSQYYTSTKNYNFLTSEIGYIINLNLQSKNRYYFDLTDENVPILEMSFSVNKSVKDCTNFEIANIFEMMEQTNYATVNELLPIYAKGGLSVTYVISGESLWETTSQYMLYFDSVTPSNYMFSAEINYDVPSDSSIYVKLNSDDIVARKTVHVKLKYIVT